MHTKLLASLLLTALIGTSLSRAVPASFLVDGGLSKQGPDRLQRRNGDGILQDWPGHLSRDQKHLISQFLPHLFAAELTGKENNLRENDPHFPNWMDFGRRSSEDRDA
ncbi:Gastrin/cholecystokinin-like peptide [Varanus komodoensis]|nr:Gastrin/cholecystokinin-like peptide [Varanus komodoensis]